MSFRMANKMAVKGEHPRHRLGAVITKGGRVLSTGYNQMRPSSYLKTGTIHAEEAAILSLLKARRFSDLVGADLYVTRFTAGGNTGLARPCSRCADLCRSVGIRRVFYSDDLGATGAIRF